MICSVRSARFPACTSTMQDGDVDVEALTQRKKIPWEKSQESNSAELYCQEGSGHYNVVSGESSIERFKVDIL